MKTYIKPETHCLQLKLQPVMQFNSIPLNHTETVQEEGGVETRRHFSVWDDDEE
jgi:hypothetical protein